MVGKRKKIRRRVSAEERDEEMTPIRQNPSVSGKDLNLFTSPSSHPTPTPKIIRTLDRFGTFTSPPRPSLRTPLIRKIIDIDAVNTPREQITEPTQVLGETSSPISQAIDLLIEKDCSDTPANSTLQLVKVPDPEENRLHSNSVSHEPSRTENDIFIDDDVLNRAITPTPREFEELFLDNNSDSPVRASAENLPPTGSHPNASHSLESHHSHTQTPVPTSLNDKSLQDNAGSSIKNHGSEQIATKGDRARQSSSLDTTQMVVEMGDSEFSEADSEGSGNGLVSVKGYAVKHEYVSLLTSIISRYGDIGANCSMKSVTFRSMCMQHVCDIVQNLKKKTNLKSITGKEIEGMIDSVTDLEKERVDVGWLRKRLDLINDAKKSLPEIGTSSNTKQLLVKQLTSVRIVKEQIEEYKKAVSDLQQKIDDAETTLSAAENEVSKTENSLSEIKDKLKRVYVLETLADDLL